MIFLNTTGEILNDTQQAAFEAYIREGGDWVGVHAAADTEYAWPFYGELLGRGAWFVSHPPGATRSVAAEPGTPLWATAPRPTPKLPTPGIS